MTVLDDLLSAATDDEDEIIRSVARRAGVLWHCERCTFDNADDRIVCDRCGSVAQDWAEPGDPDPTPSGAGIAEEDICVHRLYGRSCTRRALGDGSGTRHVAGNGRTVVAAWRRVKAETGMGTETVLLMKPADAAAVGAPIEFEHTTIRRNRIAVSVLPDTPTDAAH